MKFYLVMLLAMLSAFSCASGCSSPTKKAYEDAVAREIAIDDEFADLQVELWKATLGDKPTAVQAAIIEKEGKINDELKVLVVRLNALRPKTPDAIKFADLNDKTEALMKRSSEITSERNFALRKKDLDKILKLCEEEREVQKQLTKYSELRAMYRIRD